MHPGEIIRSREEFVNQWMPSFYRRAVAKWKRITKGGTRNPIIVRKCGVCSGAEVKADSKHGKWLRHKFRVETFEKRAFEAERREAKCL